MRRLLLIALFAFVLPLQLNAAIDAYFFDDPDKEARFQNLIAELRCLVCQNQNLADSNAELAQDMRQLTYEMVQNGSSDEEIVAFMVQRYGDFVMYRPPFKTSTAMLWVGPFIILGIGVTVLFLFIRRRNKEPVPEISAADLERAEQLLKTDKDKEV
jgi:cytochrome c-type biogenesis protein CcmH